MAELTARDTRSRIPLWSWLVSILGIALLLGSALTARQPSTRHVATGRRQLFLAVDGVGWEAFSREKANGLFKRFRHASRMIAPYPTMSHPSWTEIIGTQRAFGERGRLPTVEARWFDLDAMRVFDDPRQVIARQASPYNYMRAFDTFFDPLIEPLMYFPGRRLFDRELEETERAILDGFTGERFNAYISGTDAMAHTHKDDLHAFLGQLDAMIERVVTTLDARGDSVDVWMVSDHGNVGAFAEGEAESYLTPVSMNPAIRRAGLVRRDTGTVLDSNDVSVVTIALASMVNLYFPDLSKRRRFADEVLRERGVTLVTWMDVADGERTIVVRAADGGEAAVRWRVAGDGRSWEYTYRARTGNPLAIPDSLTSRETVRWVPDSVARHASIDGPWPDALHRLVATAEKRVENAPDLIVNLADGFAHDGDFGRTVRMVRTHGSMSARATFGIVASTSTQLPHDVRADEVIDAMRVTPRQLLRQADWLHPLNPDSVVRAQVLASPQVATRHADHSADADFLRRARPVVQSIGYFDWTRLRGLQGLVPSSADSPGTLNAGFDWKDVQKRLSKVDVLQGLARGVDTLLALADSLDPAKLDDRLRTAADQVRGIPELMPLAGLYDDWDRRRTRGTQSLKAGGGAGIRTAAMLSWTLPFFLQASLDFPETDSVLDSRDRPFARDWRRAQAARVRADPERLMGRSRLAATLFSQVFAERSLWQRVEPAAIPLLYDPELSGITVVLVPGIYGELFDGEIWQRGLHAVRERLGVRTMSVRVDGRCSSTINASTLLRGLRDDTRRRIERGYARPRYLLIGYSKGGVDATEALLADSVFAHQQVAALVTIATPHLGSPVAERAELPASLVRWASRDTIPTACATDGSAPSLYPATRRAFWGEFGDQVGERTRLFSLALTSDVHDAHPWMKLTKQVGQFTEPNDGVVALSASRFPADVPSVDLGSVRGDHIAGITASAFPQEAFLESVVITLGELGALDSTSDAAWATAQRDWRHSAGRQRAAATIAPPFATSLRARAPLPGGSAGWTPQATFRLLEASSQQDRGIRTMMLQSHPDGLILHCDQRDLGEFRREYEFIYDAGNGGREGDLLNGFSIVADKGATTGRACHLATQESAIKMTTVSLRFRPVEYPSLSMRLRVPVNVRGVDPGVRRRGASDAAFKLWFVVVDKRPGVPNATRLFGYTWNAADRDGLRPKDGSFLEAVSSRRSLVVTTLPEAWLVAIGAEKTGDAWQQITRDLAADLRKAYPNVPTDALEVVGITIQSDSDESKGKTEVYLDEIAFRPRVSTSKGSP
ncbi:MAG: DUF3047 domain-containing protein [Gemmatimonadaceae bacterium]|nr:DUF3047 domain-containing protein [Gemmatimonadaceae bacterium]